MRILFLNYEYPPLGGGAANATFYLLQEFAKFSELEIELVTSSADNNYHLENLSERVKIHKLPIGKNGKNLHFQTQKDLLVYTWKACSFCKKLAKEKKFDLTLAFFGIPCGFLALCLKRKYKIPYVVSLRGSDVPGYSERFSFIYKALNPLIKIIWKKASAVVANSEGLKNLALKTRPDQKIGVIYNGIDTDAFKPTGDLEAGLLSHTEAKLLFRILCVSRLTERKGINYLADAFNILSEKYNNIFLDIVGEGDAKSELIEQAIKLGVSDKINFTGRIEHEKLPEVFQSADIFVLPSLNEGMSNTILEAIASGLPVVVTDTGGTKELVKDGINGLIVKMRDANDLAEKIEKLITNENQRQYMAQESRKIAIKFNWKSIAEKYLELFTATQKTRIAYERHEDKLVR